MYRNIPSPASVPVCPWRERSRSSRPREKRRTARSKRCPLRTRDGRIAAGKRRLLLPVWLSDRISAHDGLPMLPVWWFSDRICAYDRPPTLPYSSVEHPNHQGQQNWNGWRTTILPYRAALREQYLKTKSHQKRLKSGFSPHIVTTPLGTFLSMLFIFVKTYKKKIPVLPYLHLILKNYCCMYHTWNDNLPEEDCFRHLGIWNGYRREEDGRRFSLTRTAAMYNNVQRLNLQLL